MDLARLDAKIIAAHARGDAPALVALYTEAAGAGEGRRERFFLTQAYVIALEAGLAEAQPLHARLVALGAEE